MRHSGEHQTMTKMKEDKPLETKPETIRITDTSSSKWYLNRELTWLEFNRRVLAEGQDPRTPLLERVFFIAVVGSNLDEFFMKRIGGLKQQLWAGVKKPSIDGMLPKQQLDACARVVEDLLNQQQDLEETLRQQLAEEGIRICQYGDLSPKQQQEMTRYFRQELYPLLIPQGIDPAHPFPFISNLSLNWLVATSEKGRDQIFLNRLKIPTGIGAPRFIKVGNDHLYITFEDLISNNLEMIFPGLVIHNCELFRVTRNAITERTGEQANDLLAMIESALRDRKFADIVRLEVGSCMTQQHRGMLAAELGIDSAGDVIEVAGIMGKKDLLEISKIDRPSLHYPPHQPCDHPKLLTEEPNIFHILRAQKSILLQHPYESFEASVERFLKEASTDPKVLVIKMTLYRTSADSRIIEYLIDAAQNGKQVAVVVELMARFDESANIRWAEAMEEAGIHVTYGVVGLKTHSKVIFVVRRDYNGLQRYAHIGTGNYHAGTARGYSDIGLLTNDPVICEDLTELFNYLTTGYAPARKYQKLLPSPNMLKKSLLAKDRAGDQSAQRDQSRSHPVQDQRHRGQADHRGPLPRLAGRGHVDLIVRDSCRLRPGIPGLSENISVISVVGRFLEHSRIYYFRNGGNEEYFIGSADLMKRNLEERVEVVAPIEGKEMQATLREVLDVHIFNRRSVWDMHSDGSYTQRRPREGEDSRTVQEILIDLAEQRIAASPLARRKKGKKKGKSAARKRN
jgi:polyphosphate kinase